VRSFKYTWLCIVMYIDIVLIVYFEYVQCSL